MQWAGTAGASDDDIVVLKSEPTSAEDEPSAARDIPGYAEMCVKIAKDLEREQQAQGMELLKTRLSRCCNATQMGIVAHFIQAHREGSAV